MKRQPQLSLILPCFNEGKILKKSVEEIISVLNFSRLSYELIFIDDKSTDNTKVLLQQIVKNIPQSTLLLHSKNAGRGKTVVDGIKVSKGIVIGYIDIDLEVSPLYVPFITKMILEHKADIILGKRVYRTSFISLPRELFSRGYAKLVSILLGTGGLDTESGYKFFERKKILPIIKKTTHPHWFWDTELMVMAKNAGLRILEIPVLYIRRFDKKSTVRILPDIINYLISVIRFKRRLNRR